MEYKTSDEVHEVSGIYNLYQLIMILFLGSNSCLRFMRRLLMLELRRFNTLSNLDRDGKIRGAFMTFCIGSMAYSRPRNNKVSEDHLKY